MPHAEETNPSVANRSHTYMPQEGRKPYTEKNWKRTPPPLNSEENILVVGQRSLPALHTLANKS